MSQQASRLDRPGAFALFGVLRGLVAVNLPELGSDPWPFRPPYVDSSGPLAPLVRAAGSEWDTGIARAAAFSSLLLVGAAALVAWRRGLSRTAAVALVLMVGSLLLAPSTLLQLGLRDSTAPWFHTNDSTYQIELAGELLLDGRNPYGHDYRYSGLERFYNRDGTISAAVRSRELALRHYAYFPGSALTAAPWRLLPEPFAELPPVRAANDPRLTPRRAALPRAARLAPRGRGYRGSQPDRRSLGLVRPERRAEPALPLACLRPLLARALPAGRREPCGGRSAEAVRGRRRPLSRRHADQARPPQA